MPGSSLANLASARAARASGNLEASLLNSLGDAVIATDLDGYIIFWNREAETLYGWIADEVEGRNIIDILTSSNSRALGIAIFEKLTKGDRWSGEFETRHKDGHPLLIDVTDYPVRDQQGRLTSIVGISKPANPKPASVVEAPLRRPGLQRLRFIYEQVVGNISHPGLLRGFALAALLYGLALAARLELDQILAGRLPFLTFYPAVFVSPFISGLWPTVVLMLASAVTGAVLYAPNNSSPEFAILIATFFVITAVIAIAPAFYANIVLRSLKQKDEQLILLNRELTHRIKNLFAVTSSICVQTIKSGIPREEIAEAVTGRIQAVASAQDLISATAEQGSDLRTLVEAVVRPLSPDASRLELDGASVSLTSEATVPLALILHELATNAAKHGAWASTQGRTIIQWRLLADHQLEFTWREENVSLSGMSQREGFGSVLIKRALCHAEVHHEIGPRGAFCQIKLPL